MPCHVGAVGLTIAVPVLGMAVLGNTRRLEAVLGVMVALMRLAFIGSAIRFFPGFKETLAGFVPKLPGMAEGSDNSLYVILAPVSILVNNAGRHLKKPAEEVTTSEFQKLIDVHLLGAHALSVAAGRRMLGRGHGSLLFIASMASVFGLPGVVAYSAVKSAYLGVVRTLATEWGPRGVRVNAIAPGWIDSAMMRRAVDSDPQRKARILARTPLGTFGEADDIGRAATFLCSPAAKFITGACLPVDGGASVGF